MLEASDQVEPAHPAATVVLVRDGRDGLETLLVQRSKSVQHMGGMWVFPGGRVDEQDYPADGDDFTAALNAAIRETREETGLEISAEQLLYLSHWTTPEGAKRRFATWFFLCIVADGQEVTVDGGEISSHRWLTPAAALAEHADTDHSLRLMPPTFVSLVDIEPYERTEVAQRALGGREAIIYAPRMVFVDDGICFLYGGDAGYDTGQLDVEGPRHRVYMVNDQFEYLRQL